MFGVPKSPALKGSPAGLGVACPLAKDLVSGEPRFWPTPGAVEKGVLAPSEAAEEPKGGDEGETPIEIPSEPEPTKTSCSALGGKTPPPGVPQTGEPPAGVTKTSVGGVGGTGGRVEVDVVEVKSRNDTEPP